MNSTFCAHSPRYVINSTSILTLLPHGGTAEDAAAYHLGRRVVQRPAEGAARGRDLGAPAEVAQLRQQGGTEEQQVLGLHITVGLGKLREKLEKWDFQWDTNEYIWDYTWDYIWDYT